MLCGWCGSPPATPFRSIAVPVTVRRVANPNSCTAASGDDDANVCDAVGALTVGAVVAGAVAVGAVAVGAVAAGAVTVSVATAGRSPETTALVGATITRDY